MAKRFKKHLSPGLVLGLIALIVAVGGSSFAIAQSGKKQDTLRTRIGGATQLVAQTFTIPPSTTNGGNADQTITCPSNTKLGSGVALGGGVVDLEAPVAGRNLVQLEEKTDGPVGKNAWIFQFDNDAATERQVQLRVLCTFSKLNTKRG